MTQKEAYSIHILFELKANMDKLSYSQQQRLYFIDFRLMFVGSFTRAEVVQHFKLGLSAATRDIYLYKELAAQNLHYDNTDKCYFKTEKFIALFPHDGESVLKQLTSTQTDINNVVHSINLPFEAPTQLVVPELNVLAVLTQATLKNIAVDIEYISLSSGQSTRTIVPHAIIDNGLRWHIRAYDYQSCEFRDFVITRMTKAALSQKSICKEQSAQSDQQWIQKVALELVPHPTNIKYPQAIELDYGMENGVLHLTIRSALTGYLLRRWNVDCSANATQQTPEHHLWLRNNNLLSNVTNLHLTSGFNLNTLTSAQGAK